MARPIKQGLDYFPLDVDMDQDEKIQLVESEIPGSFGLIIKLLMKIYRNGYFIQWDDKAARIFAINNINSINVYINGINGGFNAIDVVKNLIDVCINEGVFDIDVFNGYGVLTSVGIQRRYFNACVRRKSVNADKNLVIVDINSIDVCINWINVYRSTQSKVKESKVKESKETLSCDFEKFWNAYDKKIDRKKSERAFSKLSKSKIELIFESLPAYVESTPDPQFRKNPLTYLNGESWGDQTVDRSAGRQNQSPRVDFDKEERMYQENKKKREDLKNGV